MTVLTLPTRPSTQYDGDLAPRLRRAMSAGSQQIDPLAEERPASRRDQFATLLEIYELWSAPIQSLGARARYQSHPAVSTIKQRCERDWLQELEAIPAPDGIDGAHASDAMRALAARDRLPSIYKWLAAEASWEDVVTFLALEGGPDAGFDDLVAACQIGLRGRAKLELATNYWDEMGNGQLGAVHTTLHERFAAAIELPRIPMSAQPTSALERAALSGLLSTNRWLQPESLGALGLTELQAGPRCRLVLQAFDRCDAPAEARPFYDVHADVDPRHGRDWLDNAITPTVTDTPDWSARIVRGAHWRTTVNAVFFTDVERMLRS